MKNRILCVVLSGLAFSTLALASTPHLSDAGYLEKLATLQTKIQVSFPTVPFERKVEGVNHLYDLVFHSGVEGSFGKEALIRAVNLVDCTTLSQRSPEKANLRRFLIVLCLDGSDNSYLVSQIPGFDQELKDIATLEGVLQTQYPKLVVQRDGSPLTRFGSTNRGYFQHLSLFADLLRGPVYGPALARFDQVTVIDSTDWYSPLSSERYDYIVWEDNHTVLKKGIRITLSYTGRFEETSSLDAETLARTVDVTAIAGFAKVSYSYFDSAPDTRALYQDLAAFLTPARITQLKGAGVEELIFTDVLETKRNWLDGKKLFVGKSLAEMEHVFQVLFGG